MSSKVIKNTSYKISQTLFAAILGLLTTRLLIAKLGFEGFGIFYLLFSLPNLVNFLQPGLTISSVRFMSVAIGKSKLEEISFTKDYDIKQIFNTFIFCYFIISVFLVVLAVPIGTYLILNVFDLGSVGKRTALVIFIVAIICVCISLQSSPYRSVLIANQNFKILSLTASVNKVLNFSLIYFLGWGFFNISVLIQYAVFRLFTNVLANFWIITYTFRKYKEVSFDYSQILNFKCLSEVLSFTSVMFMTQASFILRNESIKVITNIFFGPVGTSSLTISNQLFQNVGVIISSLPQVLTPQLGRYVGENKFKDIIKITSLTTKTIIIFSASLIFPLLLNLEYIVTLWTGKFNSDIQILCVVMLLSSYVNYSSIIYANAITMKGIIKQFEILSSLIFLGVLPLLYLSLLGYKYILFIPLVMLIGSLLQSINRILSFNKSYKLSHQNILASWFYCLVSVFSLESMLFLMLKALQFEGLWTFVISSTINLLILFVYSKLFIFSKGEYSLLLNRVNSIFRRKDKEIAMQ